MDKSGTDILEIAESRQQERRRGPSTAKVRAVFDAISSLIEDNPVDAASLNADDEANFILCSIAGKTNKLVPAKYVVRFIEINIRDIYISSGYPAIKYKETSIPLISLDANYTIPESGAQEVVIITYNGLYLGLLVDKVVDIVTADEAPVEAANKGISAKVHVNKKLYGVIDVAYYFNIMQGKNPLHAYAVLLVDSSPFFLKFIPPSLDKEGYGVATAENIDEATAILEKGPYFSAVLVDADIYNENFGSLCSSKKIPVIALSSASSEDVAEIPGCLASVAKTNNLALLKALENIKQIAS